MNRNATNRTALATLAVLALAACGSGPVQSAAALPSAQCAFGEATLAIEPGITDCEHAATYLSAYRATYENAYGHVDLTGWTIVVRFDKPEGYASGMTYFNSRRIELWQSAFESFPHELHHVALGASSSDHHDWCSFGAWEKAYLGIDEHVYLGCPAF